MIKELRKAMWPFVTNIAISALSDDTSHDEKPDFQMPRNRRSPGDGASTLPTKFIL